MANQYGTKAWAKRASHNLEFALMLLRKPDEKWDAEHTYLEASIRTLNIIKTELEEVRSSRKP